MRRSSLCGLCVSVVNPVRRQSPSRIEPQRRGRERPAPPSISPSLRHCVIAPLRSLRAQPSSTQRRQDAETQRRRKGIQRAMNRCIWLLSVFCRLVRAPGQQRIEVAGGATPACRQAGPRRPPNRVCNSHRRGRGRPHSNAFVCVNRAHQHLYGFLTNGRVYRRSGLWDTASYRIGPRDALTH